MLGLAAARSSRRYTFATARWATCRGIKMDRKPRDEIETTDAESEDILSNLTRLAKSTDKAELLPSPEASPPELSEASSPELSEASSTELSESSSTELPGASPPEQGSAETVAAFPFGSLGLKYDPSTLPLQRELTARDNVSEEEFAMTLVHGRSVFSPHLHPRTHGIPVANIHFRSHHTPLLKLFTHFALHAAASLGIPASNVVPLPTQRSLWTVIKSPFAHKKSQENFERKVHKRAIKAWDADPEVVQRWVLYLRKNAMPGVGMKVTTWERVPLGIGAMVIEDDMDMEAENLLVESPSSIEVIAQQIVNEEMSKESV